MGPNKVGSDVVWKREQLDLVDQRHPIPIGFVVRKNGVVIWSNDSSDVLLSLSVD